jgi:ribonuclease-3
VGDIAAVLDNTGNPKAETSEREKRVIVDVTIMPDATESVSFPAHMEEFERTINFSFVHKALLIRAMTHASGSRAGENNEMMEFYGDAVLQLLVTHALIVESAKSESPLYGANEGMLTFARSTLGSRPQLAALGRKLTVPDHLIVRNVHAISERVIANATEALIAAVQMDAGMGACELFLQEHLFGNMHEYIGHAIKSNWKNRLQWHSQSNTHTNPVYTIVNRSGEAHDSTFTVAVTILGNEAGRGQGKTRKQAEQAAARQAIDTMGWEGEHRTVESRYLQTKP